MGLKEMIKNSFDNEESTINLRYKASKIVLVFVCLIFFISFFFIGTGFYRQFFLSIFSFIYLLLIINLNICFYLFIKNVFKNKLNIIYIILFILLLLIFSILLLFPIITEGGIMGFYNDYVKVFIEGMRK